MVSTDSQKIDELLTRGVERVVHGESLRKKLLSGKKLRIKLGIDPTSPNIHLGRSIPLLKLRDFQELGHQIIFIVGDFTGIIGDTSDKESERPMLTREEVEKNKATYLEQAGKILDITQVEFHNNSEWLEKLTYREIGEHADCFSVADFIGRENIKRRLDSGTRVSLREVLYPLMQGYDSVAVKADVELGGTDQWFNLLAGRTLQERFGQEPQDILLTHLIQGTDGRKMSSSWGNTITLTMEPSDMYGKLMSMSDENIGTYLRMCTRIPLTEVEALEQEVNSGNPRDVKMKLAKTIVQMYHSEATAQDAERIFIETFQNKGIPDDVPSIEKPYVEALVREGFIASKSELRRLIDAGGVRNAETDEKLTEVPEHIEDDIILKLGKRRFVKLVP